MTRREHEFEPVHGLPERLPQGERILWQGGPDWWALSRSAFHVRKVAFYFGSLLAWKVGAGLWDGAGVAETLISAVPLLLVAITAVGLLGLIGWLNAKYTVYTITDRRVVLRIGVALTISVNLPFAVVATAGLKENADGTGDIVLQTSGSDRVAFVHLWPHTRPWRVSRPEPMLRAIPDAAKVAGILSEALNESLASTPVRLRRTRKAKAAARRPKVRPVAVAAE